MNIKQLKIALGTLKRILYDTRLDTLGYCGKNVRLEYPISFHNPKNVFLEDNVIVKSDSLVVNTTGKLIMKKNSGAAQKFTVITGNHHPVKNRFFFESVKLRLADVEKDVIVGGRCSYRSKCYNIMWCDDRTRMYSWSRNCNT